MALVSVHPIQQEYTVDKGVVTCGKCGTKSQPRHPGTPARVTHLVHLVREHLDDVNRTFSPKGRAEEIKVEITV